MLGECEGGFQRDFVSRFSPIVAADWKKQLIKGVFSHA